MPCFNTPKSATLKLGLGGKGGLDKDKVICNECEYPFTNSYEQKNLLLAIWKCLLTRWGQEVSKLCYFMIEVIKALGICQVLSLPKKIQYKLTCLKTTLYIVVSINNPFK